VKSKGLDDFVMNIMSNVSSAEDIMRAKNIDPLPESEERILKKFSKIKEIETVKEAEKEKQLSESESKEVCSVEDETETEKITQIPAETSAQDLSGLVRKTDISTDEDILDETKEKEWVPEIPTEKVPLRVEEYVPKQEVQMEIDEDKSPPGKVHIAGTLKEGVQPTKILSEKAKRDIGREGEKYALYCILKEKLEHYFSIKIEGDTTFEDLLGGYSHIISETNQGFRLQKDGEIIVEVIWLNKNGESGEHYDIEIKEKGDAIFIEVKSTKEYGKAWFEVSKDQWGLMKEKGDKFYIYRVYGAGTKNAKIKKIPNPAKLWKEGHINAYPIRIEI